MVEKIYITPASVRGLGNIISPKTTSDFTGNYANLTTDSEGNFVLTYQGLLLKFSTSLSNTIQGQTATLNITVLLEEDNTPVSGLTVGCTIEPITSSTATTDSNGQVSFTWVPPNLGVIEAVITCEAQGDYAAETESLSITIGLFLALNLIMTEMTCEDDEYYQGTYDNQVIHRSQLAQFITDVSVADGGERIVDDAGLVRIASKGDLIVTYDSIEDSSDYPNVLFEEEVNRLVGSVCGVSVNGSDEIVLTRLDVGDVLAPLIVSSNPDTVGIGDTCSLIGVLANIGGASVSGQTIYFFEVYTLTSISVSASSNVVESGGTVSLYGRCKDSDGSGVPGETVYFFEVDGSVAPSVASVTLTGSSQILSYADSDTLTLTATVLDSSSAGVSGQTVEFFNGVTSMGTATTDSSGVATKTYNSSGAGDLSFTAVCEGVSSSTYNVSDYLYVPALDGTESITQISGTTTIANNEMSGGSGYLTTAWDNTGNWELTFDGKLAASSCGIYIIKPTETSRDNNEIMMDRGNCYIYTGGTSTTVSGLGLSSNTYYTFTITKSGTTITVNVNNTTKTFTWSLATSLDTLCIGVDSWGGTSYIKNITVKPI